MTHYVKWAEKLCTVRSKVDRVKLAKLVELPRDAKLHLLALHDAGHGFELWQASEGVWNCRVRIGVCATHCVRPNMTDVILHTLATPGTEVPR